MFRLKSAIAPDAFVRVIDAFLKTIDLKSFGFYNMERQEEGCSPYYPSVLLPLHFFFADIKTYSLP